MDLAGFGIQSPRRRNNVALPRSFGVFQEEAKDIAFCFDPSAAPERTYLFHPTHTMTDGADGSLTVCFRSAGLFQIAHHLMTVVPRWPFLRRIGSRY